MILVGSNSKGQVIANIYDPGDQFFRKSILIESGKVTPLELPSGYGGTWVSAINENGDVVGVVYRSGSTALGPAWRWSGARSVGATAVPAKPAFYNSNRYFLGGFFPRAMNATSFVGEEFVFYGDGRFNLGYVVWRDPFVIGLSGGVRYLDYSAVNHWTCRPLDINAGGQVAGELVNNDLDDAFQFIGVGSPNGNTFPYEYRACTWSPSGAITVVGNPPGFSYARSVGINDTGVLLGNAFNVDLQVTGNPFYGEIGIPNLYLNNQMQYLNIPTRAFLWDGASITPLNDPTGGNSPTNALAIDNANRVLLRKSDSYDYYLAKDGAMMLLNNLFDEQNNAVSGLPLFESVIMDKNGAITYGGSSPDIVQLIPVNLALQPPTLAFITPSRIPRNTASPTVTLNGGAFYPQSQVTVDDQPRPTTYLSPGQLQVALTAQDVANLGIHDVKVVNPKLDAYGLGGTSAPEQVVVTYETPIIDTVTPNAVPAGTLRQDFVITGSHFISGKMEVLLFSDYPFGGAFGVRATLNSVTPTQIQCTVDATDVGSPYFLQYPGHSFLSVTVRDPNFNSSHALNDITVTPASFSIANLTVKNVNANGATVAWNTPNVATSGKVDFGTTTAYGSSASDSQGGVHAVALTGLTPAKTYYYRVTSAASGTTVAATGSFVTPPAGVPSVSTATTLARVGGNIVATVTVRNTGTGAANNVQLTTATLGGTATTNALPISMGTIPAGGSQIVTVNFSGAIGAAGSVKPLRLAGTYTGGSFSSSVRATLP